MQHAIDALQIALATATHNEQIRRSEGRTEEADRTRETAESINEGLSFLQSVSDGHLKEPETFLGKISRAINCHSLENGSDTPDFILAEYLKRCLENFDLTVQARTAYFGQVATEGDPPHESNETGYRSLTEGEVLQEDDEFEIIPGSWRKTTAAGGCVTRTREGSTRYRRPITELRVQEYRLLTEGETLQESDEFKDLLLGWVKTKLVGSRFRHTMGVYRRPVKCSLDSPSQSDSITK